MSQDGAARFYKLEEDITCSICFEELHDAVCITCGHTFCRGCITKCWDAPELQDYCCPECRKICPKDQLIPNYRLKDVVTKFQLAIKEEERRKVPSSALQLVDTDSGGILQLDDSVLQRCFLDAEVAEFSLCLICGIGERRKGKSTLLNYILRALHCLERSQKVSLGQYDEPLKGFEWRSGVDSVTKGIRIWSKPFILERNGEKMAVFVLDTEGSLDIVGDQENCLKLSALSMLLSSYLIFNVSACLNTTELDYLEMYRHVSKLTGEPFSLRYLQHMDILVRDWYDPDCCGREAADAYLQHEREKLKLKDSEYRGVLDILEGSSASGFLLPHPGKRFQRPRSQGRLADMDDDFREHLTTYISDLAAKIWSCQKTTFSGEKITCGDVGKELKEFYIQLQRKQHRFSTTLQVFFSNENSKNMKTIENEFEKFLLEQKLTASPFSVWPSEMRTRVSQQFKALLNKYERVLKVGNNEEKETFMNEMRSLLEEKQEHFCTEYSKLFNKYSVSFHCVVGGGVVGLAGAIAGPAGAGIGASVGVAIGAGIFYAREK